MVLFGLVGLFWLVWLVGYDKEMINGNYKHRGQGEKQVSGEAGHCNMILSRGQVTTQTTKKCWIKCFFKSKFTLRVLLFKEYLVAVFSPKYILIGRKVTSFIKTYLTRCINIFEFKYTE